MSIGRWESFDALLLTSHWEGLPRVMLEAASAGLPIVATKVGGVEEAVVHRPTGCMSRANIAGLAEGRRTLACSNDAQGTSPATVTHQLPKEFHIEEMVKQYQSLYDRLLSQRRESRVSFVEPGVILIHWSHL